MPEAMTKTEVEMAFDESASAASPDDEFAQTRETSQDYTPPADEGESPTLEQGAQQLAKQLSLPTEGETAPESAAETAPEAADAETAPSDTQLGDETKIAIGTDDKGEPVEVAMKDLVGAYVSAQQQTDAAAEMGLDATPLDDAVTQFDTRKVEGWDGFSAEQTQLQQQIQQLQQQYAPLASERSQVQSQLDRIDINSADYDQDFAQRVQFRLTQLNNQMGVLEDQYRQVEGASKASAQQQAERTRGAIESVIGGMWSEYADPATREKAIGELVDGMVSLYGADGDEVRRSIAQSPQEVAVMRDAVAYRKLVKGGAGGAAIAKKLANSTKTKGIPSFVYNGRAQVSGKARTATTGGDAGLSASNVFNIRDADETTKRALASGDLETIANRMFGD